MMNARLLLRLLFPVGFGIGVYWLWPRIDASQEPAFRVFYSVWFPLQVVTFDLFRLVSSRWSWGQETPPKHGGSFPYAYLFLALFLPVFVFQEHVPHSFYVLGAIYLLGLVFGAGSVAVRLYRQIDFFSIPIGDRPFFRGREGKWLLQCLCLVFLFFLFINPWVMRNHWTDGDEPHYLLIAHSLLHDRDANLANNFENEDYRGFYGTHLYHQTLGQTGEAQYSLHGIALPLLLLPGYALGGWFGAVVTLNLIASFLALFLLRLMVEMGVPQREACIGTGIVVGSIPLVIYSSQVFAEVPGALLTVLLIRRIRFLRDGVGSLRTGSIWIWTCLFLLVFLKFKYVPIAGVLLIFYAVYFPRIPGKTWIRWAPLAGILLVLPALDLYFTGGLLMKRYFSLEWIHQYPKFPFRSLANALVGLFFDQEFGLIQHAPIFLLAVPGFIQLKRKNRSDAVLLGSIMAVYLVAFILVRRIIFYGGWNPPARNLIPILPCLSVLLGFGLYSAKRKWNAPLAALLAWIGFIYSFALTLDPGLRYNYAVRSSLALDRLGEWTHSYLFRFFPSFIAGDPFDFQIAAEWSLSVLLVWILVRCSFSERRPEGPPRWVHRVRGLVLIPLLGLGLLFTGLLYLDNHLVTWRIQAVRAFHKTGIVNQKRIYSRVVKSVWVMRNPDDRIDFKVVLPTGKIVVRAKMASYSNVGEEGPLIEVLLDGEIVKESVWPFRSDYYLPGEETFEVETAGGAHVLTFRLVNGYNNPRRKLYRTVFLDYIAIDKPDSPS